MNLQDINWDFSAAGTWSKTIKISIMILICVLIVALWYYFDTLGQLEDYKNLEKKELTLKKQFEDKQKKTVNWLAYREQLRQHERLLDEALRQLPSSQEVANLLIDISQTGLASGLEFQLFKPADLIYRDFYSELPIQIKVSGTYQAFGMFVSGLASLLRIVTVHDIEIIKGENKTMHMNMLVKTYSDTDGLK